MLSCESWMFVKENQDRKKKIYPMVALRVCVLVCASTEQFPNKSIFIKTVSVTSSYLQSMFFIVLRRVCTLSLYMGQWRMQWKLDSTSKPPLQIGFNVSWKLCLNLCSHKWLRPTCSLVISLNMQSCNQFHSSMIFTIKNTIGGWPDKFQDIIFKSTRASDISSVMIKVVSLDNSWGKK